MGEVTNIQDAEIARLLSAGDINGAMKLAATMPRSQKFLNAMKRVGEIVEDGMKAEISVQHTDGKTEELGEFNLESPIPGHIPERVILELRQACHTATDYAGAFSDSCKAQAEKYKIKPGALKRYIKALEGDKVEEVEAEAEDLQALIANHTAA